MQESSSACERFFLAGETLCTIFETNLFISSKRSFSSDSFAKVFVYNSVTKYVTLSNELECRIHGH